MSIKSVFSPAVRFLYNRIVSPIEDRISLRRIRQAERRRGIGERIKVAFLVQMPEIWDKQASVYQAMVDDARFDPWLVIVPGYDLAGETVGAYGDEKTFFLEQYPDANVLLARQGDGWIDMGRYHFDYVFYQRPYNELLPKPLQSNQLIRVTKTCYIPYASTEWKDTSTYPRGFIRNMYFAFLEDASAESYCTSCFGESGHKQFWNIGYPCFEKCLSMKKASEYARVLWTPRWSYDPRFGGSHFVEYNDPLTDYPWGEHRLTVRPHPLMWSNFIKTGLLTEAQAADIQERWTQAGVRTDVNKDILETFDETDVLISDRSSVIPMFFLTGKPVIYCPIETEYSWLFSAILPGLYLADSWEELNVLLDRLLRGDDPLRPVRERIIRDTFLYHDHATERIITTILRDAEQAHRRSER